MLSSHDKSHYFVSPKHSIHGLDGIRVVEYLEQWRPEVTQQLRKVAGHPEQERGRLPFFDEAGRGFKSSHPRAHGTLFVGSAG
jgi:hypothetical protein